MHLPANTFSARHESRGEVTSGDTGGTTITAASLAHTKGPYAALGSATSFAYEGFTVYFTVVSSNVPYLIDIGIDDGAGNNFVIAENLAFAAAKQEHNHALYVPVHVAAGALIEARCQCQTALSPTMEVLLVGHSANPGGFPGYSRCIALGADTATSRGVNVDPGGTIHTKGAWAVLSSSCPADVAAIFGVVGFNGDVARSASQIFTLVDIGIGAASSESVLLPNLYYGWGSVWDGPNDVFFQPVSAQIAAGTRIVARAQSSSNVDSDRDLDLCLYGLVA